MIQRIEPCLESGCRLCYPRHLWKAPVEAKNRVDDQFQQWNSQEISSIPSITVMVQEDV